MKVVTDQNSMVVTITQTITQESNGLFDGEVIYAMPGLTINDVATIPDGIVPVQYCYDSTNGFTKNPNYVAPIDVEQQARLFAESQKTPDDKYKELDITTAALADVQSAKIDQLHYLYGQALANGFQAVLSDGNTYTFAWTTDDKANLMATQDAIDGQFISFPINYADVNGHPVPIASQADLTTIKAKATSFFGNQHQQVLTLVGQVKAAQDNPSVDKIVWAPAAY